MLKEYSDATDSLVEEAMQMGEKWYNMGFREGVLKGKTESGQYAFDLGFYKGALSSLLDQVGDILPPLIKRDLESKLVQISE
jgi:hypothetical protein